MSEVLGLARKYQLALGVAVLGIVLIIAGAVSSFIGSQKDDIVFEANVEATTDILVDVSGSVVNGGVYKLASSSRMQDALIAAVDCLKMPTGNGSGKCLI